ncbi:hypothetical protein Ade02nite_18970 [Paractinoplanes deccanensis]|uniref:Uncharacterized protein n=1 Tax=Paractinoplanes deccanensis TaxID=113561 RepID=A0ABQ3XZT3_9ACTN|nr:hypothetical protein [Actinoplanes deccanensis]GID73256.1 hypothetical protein Ade02nite_18970 [Actinoplanes deccanensis]
MTWVEDAGAVMAGGPLLLLCGLVVLLLTAMAVVGVVERVRERRRQRRRVHQAWERTAEPEVARRLPRQRAGEQELRR